MTDPTPTPEPRTAWLDGAPPRVHRCVTHHACACHEWMAEQYQERIEAEAARPQQDEEPHGTHTPCCAIPAEHIWADPIRCMKDHEDWPCTEYARLATPPPAAPALDDPMFVPNDDPAVKPFSSHLYHDNCDLTDEQHRAVPAAPQQDEAVRHPRTYSLVGSPHLFLVTDNESGINIGYANKIGGPLVTPALATPPPAAPTLDVEAALERALPWVIVPLSDPEDPLGLLRWDGSSKQPDWRMVARRLRERMEADARLSPEPEDA